MRWLAGLLLLALLGRALAQETPASTEELEAYDATAAYDQAIIRFNKNIKEFSTWDAFKAEVLSLLPRDTVGSCHALTGETMKPVEVTRVPLPVVEDEGWQKTSGKGWRKRNKDRTFIEYRVNEKAGVLLRIEGVRPRFFFAYTRRICEFPLS